MARIALELAGGILGGLLLPGVGGAFGVAIGHGLGGPTDGLPDRRKVDDFLEWEANCVHTSERPIDTGHRATV